METIAGGLNGAVAATLRAERAAAHLTHDQLAERSGLPVRSVYRYLNEQRDINLDTLVRLAAGLGLGPDRVIALAMERLSRPSVLQVATD